MDGYIHVRKSSKYRQFNWKDLSETAADSEEMSSVWQDEFLLSISALFTCIKVLHLKFLYNSIRLSRFLCF